MSKKTLYIILTIILGLIIIGLLVWYFVLKPKNAAPPIGSSINFTTPKQNLGSKFQKISDIPIVSLHKNNNKIMFYDAAGKLWQFDENELKPALVSQTPIENAAGIIWAANAKNIVKSGASQRDSFYMLSDPDQKLLFNLKTNVKSAAFSPDGKKIVYYVYSNSKTSSLFSSDSNGKNQITLIKDLNLRDILLDWPNSNTIAMISKPSGMSAGSLWYLNTKTLNISRVLSGLFGLEILFSPDGNSFIYSYADQSGKNLTLAFHDKNGNDKIIGGISTLIDKCVWAKDLINIYCAAPKLWPDSATLPDDYYKNAFSTSDDVWEINTVTGQKTLIFEYIGDISNLIISDDGNSLFFISKENQFLYKLIIK